MRLVDDIDGSEACETVTFSVEGREYELDLSEENAARLRDALGPFVGAARRAGGLGQRRRSNGGGPQPQQSTYDRGRNAEIREWARQHGHEVAVRGRSPASVLAAYRNEVG